MAGTAITLFALVGTGAALGARSDFFPRPLLEFGMALVSSTSMQPLRQGLARTFAMTLLTLGLICPPAFAEEWECIHPTAGPAGDGVCETPLKVDGDGDFWIAVGLRGLVLVSEDGGANWTQRTLPRIEHFHGVSTKGPLNVILGETRVYTSTDGEEWTERATPSQLPLQDILWDGSKYVAVGGRFLSSAYIVTSPDGITWTRAMHVGTQDLRGVAFNGSLYIAVGATSAIQVSEDGFNWTQPEFFAGTNLQDIDTNGTNFVIAAQGSVFEAPEIITTTNGVDFEVVRLGRTTSIEVVWTGSHYLLATTFGVLESSVDGQTWTNAGSVRGQVSGMDFENGTTMIVGKGTLSRSIGAEFASLYPFDFASVSKGFQDVEWTGSSWLAVGTGGFVGTSSNGKNWSRFDTGTTRDLFGFVRGSGDLPALSAHGTSQVLITEDFEEWTLVSEGLPSLLTDIASSGSRLVTTSNTGRLAYSDDGLTWTNGNEPPESTGWSALGWNGASFLAVGVRGRTIASTNGIDWTDNPASAGLTGSDSVYWNEGLALWMVFDRATDIYTSGDAQGWAAPEVPLRGGFGRDLASHPNGRTVAVGIPQTIFVSPDGAAWSDESQANTEAGIFAVASNGRTFLAVGEHGWVWHGFQPTCADANKDGRVSASDALLVLTAAVGEGCRRDLCDTDGDGRVTASDALRTLRKAVGQSLELLCPVDDA